MRHRRPCASIASKGGVMGWHMDGWDWGWMAIGWVGLIVLLGVVVYVAARLGSRDGTRT